MRTKANNKSRLMRFITLPIQALRKARDLYVRTITDCAGTGRRVSYARSTGVPSGQFSSLPKSFSVVSSSRPNNDAEDLRELIRAASARSLGNRVDMELYMQHQILTRSTAVAGSGVRRRRSFGLSRIDEDSPCD
ncbi:hypothetical protein CsSME_00035770 [Camellia sinensis var. sinensis]|uniref:uncharacterized protein LOC114266158 n=1 Tax=Camellia sinensis TaxID=4442 RepID=UPI0010359BBC|nr:uncharacterized protein LOC114266158 [Camellia sinensis]XP_028111573.1 uncharacterized protein LOC114309896 [Camellia sinensis]